MYGVPVARLLAIALAAAARAAAGEVPGPGGFLENGGQFPPEVRFVLADGDARWIVLDDALVLQARHGPPVHGRVRGTNLVLRMPAAIGMHAVGRLPQAARVNVLRGDRQATGLRRFDAIEWLAPDGGALATVERGPEGLLWTSAGSGVPLVEGAGLPRFATDGWLEWRLPAGALQMQPTAGSTGGGQGMPPGAIAQGITVRWSTFLGGSSNDEGFGVAQWTSGGVQHTIVCGRSYSLAFDPVMPAGGYDVTCNGDFDAFVASLSAAGHVIDWATYVGGAMEDGAIDLAIDASGNIHVVGYTYSDGATGAAFPAPNSLPQDPTFDGPCEAFVLKLNPTGTALVWSTTLGGSGEETGYGIALDLTGRTCVAGLTISPDFPLVLAAFPNNTLNGTGNTGNSDGFLSALAWKTTPTPGLSLEYSTYVTGDLSDGCVDLAVDGSGVMHMAGNTNSNAIAANFSPSVPGYDVMGHGNGDAGFVVSFAYTSPTTVAVVHRTFLEGSVNDGAHDTANAVAVDASGKLLVTGYTTSTSFPWTTGAYATSLTGSGDVFLVRLDPTVSGAGSLLYGTFYGGSGFDIAWDLADAGAGRVHLVGGTESSNLPMNARSWDTTLDGTDDAFLATIDMTASPSSALVHATYLGGYFIEHANAVVFDAAASRAVLTGISYSSDFPTTAGAADPVYSYHGDVFVTGLVVP